MTNGKLIISFAGTPLEETIESARACDREIKRLQAELEPLKEVIRNHGIEILAHSSGDNKSVELTTEHGSAVVTVPDPSLEVNQAQVQLLKELLGDQFEAVTETIVKIKNKELFNQILGARNGAAHLVASRVVTSKANTPKVTLK
jgi:hypothetical protein